MRQSAVRSVYVWSAMAAGLTESLLGKQQLIIYSYCQPLLAAVESTLPEITAQHVLEAIGDMGIARDTVIKLAYRLNLPQLFISQLEQEELTNDNLAVKVIMRWQQIDDSSTSGKGHAKLGEALRRCGQNRIARRMKLRDRAMSSPGITPSLLSHHHYCHTITTVTPSLLSHQHYSHTITTVTPSLLSHHHYCHTNITLTPSLLSHHHYYHTITTVTPTLLSHHHYCHTITTITQEEM